MIATASDYEKSIAIRVKEILKEEFSDVEQLKSILLNHAPSALEANYSSFARELKNYHALLEEERAINKKFQKEVEKANKNVSTAIRAWSIAAIVVGIVGGIGIPEVIRRTADHVIGENLIKEANDRVSVIRRVRAGPGNLHRAISGVSA